MMRQIQPRKPLRGFDYSLVQERLDGVLTNVDRDLQRRVRAAENKRDVNEARKLVLLNIFVRFAANSYHAVMYLGADIPEDSRRKGNYILVVPGINRQLLDLLFSLVYMLDDFDTHSLEYQRAGWREVWDEYQQVKLGFQMIPSGGPTLATFATF